MKMTEQDESIDNKAGGTCSRPALREQLAVYILNPLTDPAAEEIEEHLLDCRSCRELFLTMLKLRDSERQDRKLRAHAAGGGAARSGSAQVFRFADFTREWP